MISYIPSLEYMRHLCGAYSDMGTDSELTVWRCGYGVALEIRQRDKSQLVAVIGANKQGVECFALFGLPNAIRLVGELKDKASIHFTGADYPFGFSLTNKPDGLVLQLSYEGTPKAEYSFVKTNASYPAPQGEA
jgi:hypothetical protein